MDLRTNGSFDIDDLVVFYAYEILCSVVKLTAYLVMDFCLFICKLRFVSIPLFYCLVVLDYRLSLSSNVYVAW